MRTNVLNAIQTCQVASRKPQDTKGSKSCSKFTNGGDTRTRESEMNNIWEKRGEEVNGGERGTHYFYAREKLIGKSSEIHSIKPNPESNNIVRWGNMKAQRNKVFKVFEVFGVF